MSIGDSTAHHHHPHSHPHRHEHPNHDHPHLSQPVDRRTLLRSGAVGLGAVLLAACGTSGSGSGRGTSANTSTDTAPTGVDSTPSVSDVAGDDALAGFDAFADTVTAFSDGDWWLVESNGLPAHQMMVGITNWQQQVPVPQAYSGTNAWQLPRTPVLADEPVSARTGLFRGAIALAVNGVPIFNALNNRGDDAFLVGELDEYNGHLGPDGVYHYHGTATYPYINGGLVGVVEVSDQIEPQPETPAFRPAGEPLPGATITEFDDIGDGAYRLDDTLDGEGGSVEYTVTDSTVVFVFTSPDGDVTTETYAR